MACVPLRKVCPEHMRWKVKVRVVRFYEQFNTEDPPKLLRFEFIMVDDENTAMEVVVPLKWINTHRSSLVENRIYTVHYFEVINARAIYRPVDHPYMARLTKHTHISEVTVVPENFPLYGCSITPFHALHSKVGDKEHMSDVIGILVSCSRPAPQTTRIGRTTLLNVHISDGREIAALALWGSQAERFNTQELIELGSRIPVVLLFVGVTVNIFNGRLALQCSKTCTWYVNPALPETATLQQSYGAALGHPYWIGEERGTGPQNTTVAELSKITNPHEVMGNRYVITARIKHLLPDEPWWYMACTSCRSKTRPNGDTYKCYDYKCSGTGAIPRYRLAFIACDPADTGDSNEETIELICFGPLGDEFTGMTAESLVAATSGVQGYIPEQITRLYGTKHEFHVSVQRGAVQRARIGFKIDSFTRISEVEERTIAAETLEQVEPGDGKESNVSDVPMDKTTAPPLLPEQGSASATKKTAYTPVKDVLSTSAVEIATTPSHPKEKHCDIEHSAGIEALDDSDCETSTPKEKKQRTARRLSMTVAEDDE